MLSNLQSAVLFVILSHTVCCLPWHGPTQTTRGQLCSTCIGWTPKPTHDPSLVGHNLFKRVDSVPASICGWYAGQGYSETWYLLGTTNTCFFYTDLGVFGNSANTWTKCVDYHDATTYSCDAACSSSSRVLLCSSQNPWCQTVLLGTSYSEFLCIQQSSNVVLLASTFAGQTNPIAFPIFSGSQGISFGTAYPPGYSSPTPTTASSTTPTASTTSTTSTTATTSSSLSSIPISSTTSPAPSTQPQPIGPIVGGVVGGVIAICITIIVITFIMQQNRRRKDIPPGQTSTDQYLSVNQGINSTYFSKPELDATTHPLTLHSPDGGVAEITPSNQGISRPVYEVQGS